MTNRFYLTPLTGWPELNAKTGTCRFVQSGDPTTHPYEVVWNTKIEFEKLTAIYEWLAETPGLKGSYTRWVKSATPTISGRNGFYFSDLETATLFKFRWR